METDLQLKTKVTGSSFGTCVVVEISPQKMIVYVTNKAEDFYQ
jgi:hypothetical protein